MIAEKRKLLFSFPMVIAPGYSGLPPEEAPVMIAEKRKLFFSFLTDLRSEAISR